MREGFFFMIQQIVKRDGRMAPFEIDKITNAIYGAAQASGGQDHDMAQELAEQVEKTLEETAGTETPTVEQVQDTVVKIVSCWLSFFLLPKPCITYGARNSLRKYRNDRRKFDSCYWKIARTVKSINTIVLQ